ncbi:hypothetical protein NBRC10512_002550 [Rhodotorula toruloides]|uniref:RHTO0S03e07140g1_1 n=2 Tax=Rhodotorula toruloides TaxID=5286 RepID=A0A061AKZ4_RHOTO|nr:regulatory protein cys-3, transcription factor [Rhodotorula toruloides NP11]EMS25922.1 regulatory protein cys-3, transcription factor [Rhodotorula toruloides NP11]CDR38266.1 RHTO0S03e07140g1_1 [Rhodotorula toruloides]
MSGHSWAFEQLNQLAPSPGTTPANGPARDRSDLTLSFPCDPDALQAQLEQWTTVAFDFDSPPADAGPAQPLVPSSPGLPHARVGEFGFSQHYANKLGASLAAEEPHPQPSTVAPADFTSTVDLSALLGGANNGDAAFAGSLVDPALSLPSFVEPSLPSFVVPQTPATGSAATLSPAEASTSAAHTPASTVTSRKGNGAAKKKRTSTTSAAAKAAAAKEAAAVAAAAAAAAASPAANVGGRSLPLPEGIDTTGMTDEELNRLAIEEDRRRRNTAASARFRVKKKQREQALEQTAKELKERVAVLEKEVETLRTENGWLRSLVVDKSVSTAPGGAANNRKRKIEDVESTTAAIEGGLSSSSLLV